MQKKISYNELNSIQSYLKEIGNIPLLTKEEEQRLGFLLLEGDNNARNKLIESNLRLVIYIAKKYWGRGLDFMDLISEGNLALSDAVNNFDVRKGIALSAYAGVYIECTLKNAIADNSHIIKISRNKFYLIPKIIKAQDDLFIKLKRTPTILELANEIGLTLSTVKLLLNYKDDALSLNQIITSCDDELEIGDSIVDKSVDIENDAINKEFVNEMDHILNSSKLKDREKEIIYMHYWCNLTFEQIGKKYGLSRQAIDKVEKNALMKLRKLIDVDKLSLYLDYPEKGKEFVKAKML